MTTQQELDKKVPFIPLEVGQRWIDKDKPRGKRIKYCPGTLTHEPYLQPHFHPSANPNKWSADPYPRSMWAELAWYLTQHKQLPLMVLHLHIAKGNGARPNDTLEEVVLNCIDKLIREGYVDETGSRVYQASAKLKGMVKENEGT